MNAHEHVRTICLDVYLAEAPPRTGWEPEANILDKRVIRRYLRRRMREELAALPDEGRAVPVRRSARMGIAAAGERARLASNADSRESDSD